LTLGGTGEDAWSRAAYVAQLLNFSQIINEMGIVEALETYASGFLHQSAIENIWKMGGIADLVINKAEVALNEEGEVVKRVYINNERTDFIDFSLDMDDMVGYKQGNILVDCHIQIGPDGRPTTDNGKIKVSLEDKSRIVYHIKDYDLVLIEYIDAGGKTIAFASPLDGEKSIKMNDDNNLIRTGRFFNREKQVIVYKRDNTVFRVISTPRSDMTDAELQELFDHRLEAEYLDGVVIDYDKDSGDVKIELDQDALRVGEFEGKTSYLTLISANGVSNELGEYTAPTYEEVLRYRLSDNGIDQNTIYLLPMFEGKNPVRDIAMWFLDNAGVNILTSELMAKLDREIYGDIMPGQQYEPKVMVLYSGSANSFFKAINRRHDYNIRDALILGGPTLDGIFEDTVITNPNIDRVFNVWGTKDILGPVISNKRYSANVEAYNIEIIGASHCDYFYQISSGELGARASYFIEELITTAYGNSNIQYLFEKHHVVYDSGRNVYIVDPNQIDYEG
jgi:hypothetical protein